MINEINISIINVTAIIAKLFLTFTCHLKKIEESRFNENKLHNVLYNLRTLNVISRRLIIYWTILNVIDRIYCTHSQYGLQTINCTIYKYGKYYNIEYLESVLCLPRDRESETQICFWQTRRGGAVPVPAPVIGQRDATLIAGEIT